MNDFNGISLAYRFSPNREMIVRYADLESLMNYFIFYGR